MGILLLILNIGIGFWLIGMVRKQDYYSSEPMRMLVLATIVGGAIAIGITTGLGSLFAAMDLPQGNGVASFFLLTGPIEETSKLIGFFIFIKLFKVDFEEPIDAVVYMSCIALGFSLIENLGYALGTPYLLGIRSVTSTPMHIIFSVTMALVFATNTKRDRLALSLIKAVLVASFFHGLYDSLVYLKVMRIDTLLMLIIGAVAWAQKIFGYALLNSPNRRPFLENVLANGKPAAIKLCLACNKEAGHQVYSFRDVTVEECQNCKNVVIPEKKARNFFKFFLPNYSNFLRKRDDLKSKIDSVYQQITDKNYDNYRKVNMTEAMPVIELLSESFREVFEKSYTFSFIFGTRPLFSTTDGIVNEQYRNTIRSDGFKAGMILLAVIVGTMGIVFGLMQVIR